MGIVGGGIVGLAVAQELIQRNPKLKYIVLEKEKELGVYDLYFFSRDYKLTGNLKSSMTSMFLMLRYKSNR